MHPPFQKPALMGDAQSSPHTHLIPPSAFLRVETPHWSPSLSLLRKKRVSSSRHQQNQTRHEQEFSRGPAATQPPLTELCPSTGWAGAACQELHWQNKPSASILEGCPPFMGSLEQERPSRSKGSHRASINPAGKFQVCTGQRGLGLQHVGAEERMGRSSSARNSAVILSESQLVSLRPRLWNWSTLNHK